MATMSKNGILYKQDELGNWVPAGTAGAYDQTKPPVNTATLAKPAGGFTEGQNRSVNGKKQKFTGGVWVDTGETVAPAGAYGGSTYVAPVVDSNKIAEGTVQKLSSGASQTYRNGKWVADVPKAPAPGAYVNPLDAPTNRIYDLETNKAATQLGKNAIESGAMLRQSIGEAAGKTGAYNTSMAELAAQNTSAADAAGATIATAKANALLGNVDKRKTDLTSALSTAISNNDVAGANAASASLEKEFGIPKTDYSNVLGPTAKTKNDVTRGEAIYNQGLSTGNAGLMAEGLNLQGMKYLDPVTSKPVSWTSDNPDLVKLAKEINSPNPIAASKENWIPMITTWAQDKQYTFTPSTTDPNIGTWTHTGLDGKTETKTGYSIETLAGLQAAAEYTGTDIPQLPWISDDDYAKLTGRKPDEDTTPVAGYTDSFAKINPLNSGKLTGADATGYLAYSKAGGKLSDDLWAKLKLNRPLALTDLDGTDLADYNTYKASAGTNATGIEDWILNGNPTTGSVENNKVHSVNGKYQADDAQRNLTSGTPGQIKSIGGAYGAQTKQIFDNGKWVEWTQVLENKYRPKNNQPVVADPVIDEISGLLDGVTIPASGANQYTAAFITMIQGKIDTAKAAGKDVTALQAKLDALKNPTVETPASTTINYGTKLQKGTQLYTDYETYVKAGGTISGDEWFDLPKKPLGIATEENLSSADKDAYKSFKTGNIDGKYPTVDAWFSAGKPKPVTIDTIIENLSKPTPDLSFMPQLNTSGKVYRDILNRLPGYSRADDLNNTMIGKPVGFKGRIYILTRFEDKPGEIGKIKVLKDVRTGKEYKVWQSGTSAATSALDINGAPFKNPD
jgi:hypothetical protein